MAVRQVLLRKEKEKELNLRGKLFLLTLKLYGNYRKLKRKLKAIEIGIVKQRKQSGKDIILCEKGIEITKNGCISLTVGAKIKVDRAEINRKIKNSIILGYELPMKVDPIYKIKNDKLVTLHLSFDDRINDKFLVWGCNEGILYSDSKVVNSLSIEDIKAILNELKDITLKNEVEKIRLMVKEFQAMENKFNEILKRAVKFVKQIERKRGIKIDEVVIEYEIETPNRKVNGRYKIKRG